jgi:hypothetical protein
LQVSVPTADHRGFEYGTLGVVSAAVRPDINGRETDVLRDLFRRHPSGINWFIHISSFQIRKLVLAVKKHFGLLEFSVREYLRGNLAVILNCV